MYEDRNLAVVDKHTMWLRDERNVLAAKENLLSQGQFYSFNI